MTPAAETDQHAVFMRGTERSIMETMPTEPRHAYAGWQDGAAYCTCGRTFDSVQELDRHVLASV